MKQAKEKFLIIENIKKFIIDIEKLVVTFPKKDFISRKLLYEDSLCLLELVYEANYETDLEIKKRYQIKALAKINKIDFYLERAYKLRYISESQCTKNCNKLEQINKMLYSWCKNGKQV